MTLLRKILSKFLCEETKQELSDRLHTIETLQKNASTKFIWDGMIEANQLAMDCIKNIEHTKLVEDNQMSEDNLKKFLEFLFYQFHTPEKYRRSSLTLSFKPGSKVVDFVSELKVKM